MSDNCNAITRRRFLQGAAAASAALMGLPRMSLGESRRPPNFVVIFCDDMGYQDLGCFGAPLIKTPRIDRMAEEGVKFTDFYAAAAVCTPSRAAILTGCYPVRVSLPSVLKPHSTIGLNPNEITVAELLKMRGYATKCIGKWHLGDRKQFMPRNHGFDSYLGVPYSNDMPQKDYPVPLIRDEEIIEQPVVQETLIERYTREATRFITENKDRPFFLYLPHTMPHVPLSVSERFRDKSKRGLYGDVIECLDWSTGEILDTLVKLGLDQNTLVIFTSDNGPWLSHKENAGTALPLRAGKGTTWEGGLREPCVMWWPGRLPAGKVCSEVATTMDLLPTFARLAGARVPTDRIIDGEDILPLLENPTGARSHKPFFYYWKYELHGVRVGKWKLMVADKNSAQKPISPELYDLRADIGETTNVAASYPKVVERLQALIDGMRRDLGDDITGAPGKNRRPVGGAQAPAAPSL